MIAFERATEIAADELARCRLGYDVDDVQPTENLTLDDFPTLRHVLNFLRGASTAGGPMTRLTTC